MPPEAWDIIKAAGIPAILLGIIITTWIQIRAVKKGVQALLRDRLIQGYKFYRQQGWADEDDRANLENVYQQYHALGANGVMENLRQRFIDLPPDPPRPAPQTQAAATPAGSAAPATITIEGGHHA